MRTPAAPRYILVGAAFTAGELLDLAAAAGGWIAFTRVDNLYLLCALLIVDGTVIQNVVADVARHPCSGGAARMAGQLP
jgi:hypothetical protein